MKPLLFYIVFICQTILYCSNVHSEPEEQGKRIISESMIKSAGIVSLSDILLLLPDWNYSTIDGFTKTVSANGLSSLQRQNFILMVDDLKYDLNVFDIQNINLLPISITQIDYVEIYSVPKIIEGEFAGCGLIHFHTKQPPKGMSFFANEIIGNETGDPGPYRYTLFSSSNVDKIGPYFSTGIDYGSKNWSVKAGYKNEETFISDSLLKNRISYLSKNNNKAALNSGWGKVDVNWIGGVTSISGGVTNHEDFFFFKPLGYEIPALRTIYNFGVNGRYKADKNISLKYSADYSTNELNYNENNIGFNFDFRLKTVSAGIEGNYQSGLFSSMLGFGVKSLKLNTLKKVGIDEMSFQKIYTSTSIFPSKNLTETLQLYLTKTRSGNSVKGALINNWILNNKTGLSANFAYFERLLDEDMSYWSWLNKGYDVSKEISADYNVIGTAKKSKTFTCDISYSVKYDSTLSFALSGNYRRFSNYYIEQQFFQFDENLATYTSPVILYTDEWLKTAGFGIEIGQKLSGKLKHKIFYNYQQNFGASSAFENAWQVFPKNSITYMLEYNPVESFGIWTRIKYLSSSVWYDYKYSDIQTDNYNSYKLKPKIIFDLSLQKWFFKRTLWINILLRNIFNQNELFSPIGVKLNLTDYIQVHFYFDSLPE